MEPRFLPPVWLRPFAAHDVSATAGRAYVGRSIPSFAFFALCHSLPFLPPHTHTLPHTLLYSPPYQRTASPRGTLAACVAFVPPITRLAAQACAIAPPHPPPRHSRIVHVLERLHTSPLYTLPSIA